MIRNTTKTAIFLAALGGFFVLLGRLIMGPQGLVLGGIAGFGIAGFSYWFSASLAIRSANARPLQPGELPELRAMVADLAQKAEIPMPRIYIAPSAQPNAFATGRNPSHAAVAVTAGILQMLDAGELRAVLAHELSHVRNRDILLTSVAAAFGTAISMVANTFFLFGGGMGGDREQRSNPIVDLALVFIAPLAATIMQLALSRSREFEADRSGARLIHDGEPLARALLKIESYAKSIPMNIDPSHASAYIINPLSGANFKKLFSTHPPTAERVARLRS